LVAVFFLCPVTHISAVVAPIGLKFCMMVHIDPRQISLGALPWDSRMQNFDHLTENISKTVSRSVIMSNRA